LFAPDPGAADHWRSLARIVAAELQQPVPDALDGIIAEIRQRHGAAVTAIVFYGSCLRTRCYDDGVLDLYVLVDSYRAVYPSRVLAYANALLPPNVFYAEVTDGERTVRSKYAVISTEDFERAVLPPAIQSISWARFCQPARLVYERDVRAREAVIRSTTEAVITMVLRTVALLPTSAFPLAELWQRGFRETYSAELRVEGADTIRRIYEFAPDRYDRVALEALHELERQGLLHLSVEGDLVRVEMHPRRRRRERLAWGVRRLLGKPLAAARLFKSMATFGDWLPYALWKLERHTGVRIEPTEWQRRHRLLACWPIILKLLVRRVLR
jgi:hypothetical protein